MARETRDWKAVALTLVHLARFFFADKTNAALAKLRADSSTKALALDAILGHLDEVPDPSIRTTLRNAGGGYVNHDMWWKSLSPTGGLAVEPRSGELHEALVCAFGSVAQFKKLFSLSALELFGSGWAWLSLAPAANCALEVGALPNQDTPLMEGKQPLLGLDVWEHAYYLKYQSRRHAPQPTPGPQMRLACAVAHRAPSRADAESVAALRRAPCRPPALPPLPSAGGHCAGRITSMHSGMWSTGARSRSGTWRPRRRLAARATSRNCNIGCALLRWVVL